MRKITALAAVLALLVLPACSGNPSDQPGDKATTAPTSSPVNAAYRAALIAISPGLADASDRNVTNSGRNICGEIQEGKEPAIAATNAAKRFGVDPSLGPEIVEATRKYVCPN